MRSHAYHTIPVATQPPQITASHQRPALPSHKMPQPIDWSAPVALSSPVGSWDLVSSRNSASISASCWRRITLLSSSLSELSVQRILRVESSDVAFATILLMILFVVLRLILSHSFLASLNCLAVSFDVILSTLSAPSSFQSQNKYQPRYHEFGLK